MTHTCKICGANSADVEFYARVTSRCKECHKVKVRENRAEKIEYYKAYDAKRYREDPRRREKNYAYAKTDAGRASHNAAHKRWMDRNAEKRACHVILGNAVRGGRIVKPDSCSMCGAGGRIHGHHEDYTKPLDVVWVCPNCHAAIHAKDKS
jgi:hypothetical protein